MADPKIPAPEPVAYLYTDARTPQDVHPWLHSSMLVFAHDRRPTLRNEAALWTSTEAETYAAAREVAARQAERERCAKVCEATGLAMCEIYGDGAECIATADACADAIRAG